MLGGYLCAHAPTRPEGGADFYDMVYNNILAAGRIYCSQTGS